MYKVFCKIQLSFGKAFFGIAVNGREHGYRIQGFSLNELF